MFHTTDMRPWQYRRITKILKVITKTIQKCITTKNSELSQSIKE